MRMSMLVRIKIDNINHNFTIYNDTIRKASAQPRRNPIMSTHRNLDVQSILRRRQLLSRLMRENNFRDIYDRFMKNSLSHTDTYIIHVILCDDMLNIDKIRKVSVGKRVPECTVHAHRKPSTYESCDVCDVRDRIRSLERSLYNAALNKFIESKVGPIGFILHLDKHYM